MGLVPRQNSTGKTRLGRITKAGNAAIRSSLVLGATAMVSGAALALLPRTAPGSGAVSWAPGSGASRGSSPRAKGWFARRPAKLAAVALAGKLARIAWAVIVRNEAYRPGGRAIGSVAV